MGFRSFSQEELDKFFEIYRAAKQNRDGKPSVNYTAKKCQVSRDTINHLRDIHGWEDRRLETRKESVEKADKKFTTEEAKRINNYRMLERAGLNYKKGQVIDGKIELTMSELIALSKHVQVLMGNPDSHQEHSGEVDLRIRCKDMAERKRLLGELAEDLHELQEGVGDEDEANVTDKN